MHSSTEGQTWKHPSMIVLRPLRRWNIEHACYEEERAASQLMNSGKVMMLVDGCFIFEMFLKYSTMSLRRRNDPVFTPPGMLFDLRSSRMLLENQIPLFILQRLFEVVQIPKQCTHFLTELAFRLIKYMIPEI